MKTRGEIRCLRGRFAARCREGTERARKVDYSKERNWGEYETNRRKIVRVRGVNLRKAKKQKAHHDHGCRNDLKDSMLLTLTHFCRASIHLFAPGLRRIGRDSR